MIWIFNLHDIWVGVLAILCWQGMGWLERKYRERRGRRQT